MYMQIYILRKGACACLLGTELSKIWKTCPYFIVADLKFKAGFPSTVFFYFLSHYSKHIMLMEPVTQFINDVILYFVRRFQWNDGEYIFVPKLSLYKFYFQTWRFTCSIFWEGCIMCYFIWMGTDIEEICDLTFYCLCLNIVAV